MEIISLRYFHNVRGVNKYFCLAAVLVQYSSETLYSHLLSKNVKIKIYENTLLAFFKVWNYVSCIKERMHIEGVSEQGSVKNIVT